MASPRGINFWDLVLYATAMNFGIRWLATAGAAGPTALPIWVLAALGFLAPLAIATAELAGRYEKEGAIYAWTGASFGPFAGFLCGWLYWVCNLPFFSSILYFVVEVIAGSSPEFAALLQSPAARLGLASAMAIAIAGLNLVGIGVGKWLPAFGALASMALLALLLVAAGVLGVTQGVATDFTRVSYLPPLDANGAILWSTMVFAFAGAEGVALLRNEIEGGVARLVKAIVVIGAFLVAAYVAGTIAMLTILAPEEASRLSGLPDALSLGLSRLGLAHWIPAALLVLAAALLGSYGAWFGAAARLPHAAGLDRVLPPIFAARDPRTGAPTASIVLQTVLVVLLLIVSQADANLRAAYDFLVAMSVISYTLPFLFLFAAFLKVQGEPAPAGAWTAPGGTSGARAIGVLGFLVTASAIACTLAPSPDATDPLAATLKLVWSSGALILSGVALYALSRLRKFKPARIRNPPA
jgi:glutamate:GABA antiporter